MTSMSIIGTGKMSAAISDLAVRAEADLQIVKHSASSHLIKEHREATYSIIGDDLAGDLVVFAVPSGAYASIVKTYGDRLRGKIIVDIANPIDFSTYEQPEQLVSTSTALELARQLPEEIPVLKAFNCNLADTLFTGTNGTTTTTVLIAGDDAEGKLTLAKFVEAAGLRAVDAGPLQRSRHLEAIGYLQITLAASGQTQFESGFTLLP